MVRFTALALALVLILTFAGIASAHVTGPCADSDGDGRPSGYEYAQHHIRPMAQMGMLGSGGHIPGSHHGFSACIGD